MFHTLKMLLLTILFSLRDALTIPEGYEDDQGFHYGHPGAQP